ncbi:2921_t:CDS:1, partial [Acaulospora colombiana]
KRQLQLKWQMKTQRGTPQQRRSWPQGTLPGPVYNSSSLLWDRRVYKFQLLIGWRV